MQARQHSDDICTAYIVFLSRTFIPVLDSNEIGICWLIIIIIIIYGLFDKIFCENHVFNLLEERNLLSESQLYHISSHQK